jgi:two-component system response regulator DevR
MSGIIRVLLIEGHEAARKGLRQMLDSEEGVMVIGEASGQEAVAAKASELSPDVAIVLAGDSMPDEKIVDSACAISEAKLPVKVIIMAENPVHYLLPAIKAGAAGLLSDNIGRNELLSAIRRIHLWFPGSISPDNTLSNWDSTL